LGVHHVLDEGHGLLEVGAVLLVNLLVKAQVVEIDQARGHRCVVEVDLRPAVVIAGGHFGNPVFGEVLLGGREYFLALFELVGVAQVLAGVEVLQLRGEPGQVLLEEQVVVVGAEGVLDLGRVLAEAVRAIVDRALARGFR
jgi:hypothetical protein